MRVADIIEGLEHEIDEAGKEMIFHVRNSNLLQGILSVELAAKRSKNSKLDEDLEGCKVWWINDDKNAKSTGNAEILSVDIEREIIHFKYFSGEYPKRDIAIFVYPKEFLKVLKEHWENKEHSQNAISSFKINSKELNNKIKIPKEFLWLRECQKQAYDLFNYSKGILFGPPGTGKTTTLSTMIASYLISNINNKVLLMSSTNVAVDQILVSVDTELKKLPNNELIKCIRIGGNINAEKYRGKEHLIPTKDEKILKKLFELERLKPDKEKPVEYKKWVNEIENLKNMLKTNIKEEIEKNSLIALTTTKAIFEFEILNEKKFDLVIFDEASQISLAQIIMLSQLGKQVIYAGDPRQLSPIFISKNEHAKEWIGNSVFSFSEKIEEKFLDEQSRMNYEICQIISSIFYEERLIVAKDIDEKWKLERYLNKNDFFLGESVCVETIEHSGNWSQKYSGTIRYESAEKIKKTCLELIANQCKQEDIIILTPFKSQKNLIREFLKKNINLKEIKVSTVHKSQGSEYHTVIFDPVNGKSDFLNTEEAKRIINVGLSRAKARLILFFSKLDLENEIFKKIKLIKNSNKNPYLNLTPEIAEDDSFPNNLLDNSIKLNTIDGKIIKILDNNKKIEIECYKTGKIKIYMSEIIKKQILKI